MSERTPRQVLSQAPETYRVEFTDLARRGIPDGDELEGQFLLTRTPHALRIDLWQVTFAPCAGYTACEIVISPNRTGLLDVRLCLAGGADRPTWVLSDIVDVKHALELQFDPGSAKRNWPPQIQVRPVAASPALSALRAASPGPVGIGVLRAGAAGFQPLDPGDCPCVICPCVECTDGPPDTWTLTIAEMGNCACDCSALNTSFTVERYIGDPCNPCYLLYDASGLITNCPGTQGFHITVSFGSTYDAILDQCLLTLNAVVYTGTSQAAFYSTQWPPTGGKCGTDSQTLNRTSVLPVCTGTNTSCDPPTTITMTPGGSSYVNDTSACSAFYFDSATCLNHKATCGGASDGIPESGNPTCGPPPACSSCCPSGSGAGGGCSSGSCSMAINPDNGNLSAQLAVPSGGPANPHVIFTVNSNSSLGGSSAFGNGVSCSVSRSVTKLGDCDAQVAACDGSRYYYTARNQGSYSPVGGNTHTLQQLGDQTWIETGDRQKWYYDSSGQANRFVDSCGSSWTMVHSSPVSTVISPDGERTTLTYDGSGKIRRVTDPYSRITTFVVNGTGNLTRQITPELCVTDLIYNASNRVSVLVEPQGCRTSYTYDSNGWITGILPPTGGRYTYAYPDFHTTTVTDPLGNITTMLYQANRQQAVTIDPLGNRTTNLWNYGLIQTQIDATGRRTTYAYALLANGTRSLLSTQTATGRATLVYDANSNLRAKVNPLGRRTTYVRDANGQQIAVVNPLGARTTTVRDSRGLPIATINPLGNRWTSVFDNARQLIAEVTPLGYRTTYTYLNGQQWTVKNPLSHVSTTLYDLSNRILAQINPIAARTSYLYTAGCQLLATIDPLNRRMTNVYQCDRRISTVNPLGNRTSMVYNLAGWTTAQIDPLGNRNSTVFDNAGRSIATVNPLGFRNTSVLDGAGRTLAKINPLNRRNTTVYDAAGRSVAQIDPLSNRSTTVFDAADEIIATVNPLGNRWTSVFDAAGRGIASVNPLGKRSTTVFDAASQMVAMIDALTNRSTTVYDVAGRTVGSINALGFRATTVFDGANETIAQIDPLANRTTSVFDAAGRKIVMVDPLLNRSTTIFDAANQTTATVNALRFRTTFAYDAAGQRRRVTNARGYVTTSVYDAAGRTIAGIDALGNRSTTVFDAASRKAASVNALGNRWTSVYDADNETIARIDPLSNRNTSVFDVAGRTIASVDPLGHRNTTIFDAASQVKSTINALGYRTSFLYDVAGQRYRTTDANGKSTTTIFDADGRGVATINALGNRTTTILDAIGNTKALVDTNTGRNTMLYNNAGNKTANIDPLARRTTAVYDAAGRQNLRIDARGNRTTYVLDGIDETIGRKYPDGSRATFVFDSVGNRVTMRDSTGRYTYAYDAVDRKTMVTLPSTQRLTYAFDTVGQRRYLLAPTGGRFSYSFDAAQRITRVLNPEADRTSYTYDAASRRTVKKLANGTRASFSYDNANELARVANIGSGGTTISSYAYRYDPSGNRTAVAEADASRVTWLYDNTYQLTGENRTGTSPYRNTFTYDSRGNRLVNNQGGTRTTTTYDAADQIDYSQAAAGRTTYVFDANGNQQTVKSPAGTRITTTWNYENQPTRYNQPVNTTFPIVTMAYTADNQRAEKDSPVATTKFIWDDQNYLAEADDANTIQTLYTNEPKQYGDLISTRLGSSSFYHHFDAVGSTRQLTNATGTVTDAVMYDAWGNVVNRTGTTDVVLLWIAEVQYYYDSETALVWVQVRPLEPVIGRWTTVDPIRFGDGPNHFLYARNCPAHVTDPSGLHFAVLCSCQDFLDTIAGTSRVSGRGATRCPVRIRCRDCGNNVGSTTGNARRIDICLPNNLRSNMRVFRRIFDHEWVHAKQICTGRITTDCDSCMDNERLAYIKSCGDYFGVRSETNRIEFDRCLACGQLFSCREVCQQRVVDQVPPCTNEDVGIF